MVARLKLKGIDRRAPPGVEPLFLDSMGSGAWPFLVGGVICLVNSDNERDLNLLNSQAILLNGRRLLRGTISV
ncbi:4551_t:CDS:2 [Gigaspora rosea]|nr:4551_t:CDS:2 [Gigaspora rosea]